MKKKTTKAFLFQFQGDRFQVTVCFSTRLDSTVVTFREGCDSLLRDDFFQKKNTRTIISTRFVFHIISNSSTRWRDRLLVFQTDAEGRKRGLGCVARSWWFVVLFFNAGISFFEGGTKPKMMDINYSSWTATRRVQWWYGGLW